MEQIKAEPIDSLDGALVYFIKSIKRKYDKELKIVEKIQASHGIVGYKLKGTIPTPLGTEIDTIYHLFFKRQYFMLFEKIHRIKNAGIGQGLRYSHLQDAVREGATIVTVMRDCNIYYLDSHIWNTYVKEHKTLRTNKLDGTVEAEIPIRIMYRL